MSTSHEGGNRGEEGTSSETETREGEPGETDESIRTSLRCDGDPRPGRGAKRGEANDAHCSARLRCPRDVGGTREGSESAPRGRFPQERPMRQRL